MTNILVAMQVCDKHKEQFDNISKDVNVKYIPFSQVQEKDVEDANIIVGNVSPSLLKAAKNLKLLQLNSAGYDGYADAGVMPKGATLANATGAYGLAISEHMMGVLLTMMKKIDKYILNQQENKWLDHGPVKAIYGSKTLVVGLGDIGNEFAKRMHALGSSVTGIRRNVANKPEYIENLCTMDKLNECLAEADIVALCLPGTKDTYKLFNAESFANMKPGSYFINVGRGNVVDTDALCDALNSGKLVGAAVDVTDPEPLPADHPLWDATNVIITPHISGGYHLQETHDRIVKIAINNINHYMNNEPFTNVIKTDGE